MNLQVANRPAIRRTALAVALSVGFAGVAFAQATTGSIFGDAPAAQGETVLIQNSTGFSREVPVDASGRFVANQLPLGDYTITLRQNGQDVDSRKNVTLRVGAGTQVSFAGGANSADAQNLSAITVSANALPSIDVTGVDSRTVITAEQLAKLPLARSAEAIALLAPGVVQGSSYFTGNLGGPVVSFGGSSVTENAYYINGFNTTDPLNNVGGMTLPYGAIDQQEILQGGYSAAYGRSDGGVISQVGKRGTNEWHFGGQIQWTPSSLKSDPKNYYYVNKDGSTGAMRQYRNENKSWTTTVDAYVGGPLIKDKLFFFAAVEGERQQGTGASLNPSTAAGTGSNAAPYTNHSRIDNPKWYGKIDWNINDNNILELTGASSKSSYEGSLYAFDYATLEQGDFVAPDTHIKNGSDLYSAKFTSYLTDDLTLSAMYGKMKGTYYSDTPGYDPTLPYLYSAGDSNDAFWQNGQPPSNSQRVSTINLPGHKSTNTNLRIDLTYRIGDHTIAAGIDNQDVRNDDAGTKFPDAGLGYGWEYNTMDGDADGYIIGGPGTENPGADWRDSPWVANTGSQPGGETGFYVARYRYHDNASVRVQQRAQYIEDSWQVNDRWLVKLGLRNDQFTNYGADGRPYLRLTKPQWAPRLGATWDVNGDSSFKIYANAGRYYLAMPTGVALRAAGSSLYTREYYTYTGIDANGIPTGLHAIDTSRGAGAQFSANGEYGQPRDPKLAAMKDLKSEYQDEFILGFDKKLGDNYVWGAKATYRNLRNAIDDIADAPSIIAKMNEMGIDPATYDASQVPGSILINPGKNATFYVAKRDGSYYEVPMDWSKDFGFNTKMKRKYYGLNLYLEHPFDGKWYGKVDYLWSHSFGNTEGQVRSDVGQTDVSATMDWDYASIMDYANGAQANDRRHQIKAYGSYQIAPEWLISGNVNIASGSPIVCLGPYGADGTYPGLGYGPYYHFCNGVPSAPGAKRTDWTYRLDLSAEYRPEWGGKKLAFNAMIYNVLNSQRTTQYYGISTSSSYMRPISSQTPRYVRFGVSYDF